MTTKGVKKAKKKKQIHQVCKLLESRVKEHNPRSEINEYKLCNIAVIQITLTNTDFPNWCLPNEKNLFY